MSLIGGDKQPQDGDSGWISCRPSWFTVLMFSHQRSRSCFLMTQSGRPSRNVFQVKHLCVVVCVFTVCVFTVCVHCVCVFTVCVFTVCVCSLHAGSEGEGSPSEIVEGSCCRSEAHLLHSQGNTHTVKTHSEQTHTVDTHTVNTHIVNTHTVNKHTVNTHTVNQRLNKSSDLRLDVSPVDGQTFVSL